jgi:serine-type D-Ala-D-Ala carboxypeptidase
MRKIWRYILFLVLSLPGVAVGQTQKELQKELDLVLKSYIDSGLIPGAVLQVQYKGEIIYRKAKGYADRFDSAGRLLKKPEKMTVKHLFDIASLTKVTGTTTSILLLTEQGKLHPDDAVGKYIPAFNTPDKKEISIRHLLTHTAGLYEWYPLYYRAHNREETYGLIASLPLKYPVGKARHYSDLGFIILGQIIERVTGMPLEKYEHQELFFPLVMENTGYRTQNNGWPRAIAPTSFGNPYEYRMVHDSSLGFVFKEINPDQWNGWRHYQLRGEVNDGNCWYACGGVNGAAGIFSTAGDLQKLVNLYLKKWQGIWPKPVSDKTIDLFLTKDKYGNGLGWMMDPTNSFMKNAPEGSFGHTGFTGTSIAVVPSMQLSVILLVNRQNRGLLPAKEYYNLNNLRRTIFETIMKSLK